MKKFARANYRLLYSIWSMLRVPGYICFFAFDHSSMRYIAVNTAPVVAAAVWQTSQTVPAFNGIVRQYFYILQKYCVTLRSKRFTSFIWIGLSAFCIFASTMPCVCLNRMCATISVWCVLYNVRCFFVCSCSHLRISGFALTATIVNSAADFEMWWKKTIETKERTRLKVHWKECCKYSIQILLEIFESILRQ